MTQSSLLAATGVVALGGVVLLAGLVLAGQRVVLFPGTARAAVAEPQLARHGVVVDWIETAHGRVESWTLTPGPDSSHPAPALLFCHGNGELIDDWLGPMTTLRDRGIAVALVEYPGYGRSTGSPSQESIAASLRVAYDRLVDRPEIDAERVVLFGRSLGGGAVGTLLGRRPAAAVVLQSTFTDVPRLARRLLPIVPSFLIRDPFDTRRALADYGGPVLVVHGRDDDLIPFTHGEALAAAAARSELVSYACRHNDCPPDWREFTDRLVHFLERHGLLRARGSV